ncbi:MAG: threonine synthase [Treponema sp.]|jgi:threonine synthase|nr:threonine synthase [Treponema sp.]
MRYHSTRRGSPAADFAGAALTGLAPDGGLYIPEEIPRYRDAVKRSLGAMDFHETAFETIRPYVAGVIPDPALEDMIRGAFPFTAPLVSALSPAGADRPVLELFHGPTAAFKDFGARFMARSFSYLRRGEEKTLRILAATSGDTGGAVADGFYGVQGIAVTVLYPKGRVSELQEKQIAGLGGNISALAVEGSFDDCQGLVKAAFRDRALTERLALSSANSINIARLIPQAVYYAAAAGRAAAGKRDPDGEATPRCQAGSGAPRKTAGGPASFCVPCGNFGNLTAGLYARAMGAPIADFIAATNINKTIPDYLESGEYKTRPSRPTISNAMDVGAPSNFERMSAHWSYEEMRGMIRGCSVSDDETRGTIAAVRRDFGYYLDPHGAVGWTAAEKLAGAGGRKAGAEGPWPVVLATAHPAKFAETVESLTGPVPVPESIRRAMVRRADAKTIPAELDALRDFLLA